MVTEVAMLLLGDFELIPGPGVFTELTSARWMCLYFWKELARTTTLETVEWLKLSAAFSPLLEGELSALPTPVDNLGI
eukprot:scaffold142848_cov18-Tisochrysis_lutea.AAC.2